MDGAGASGSANPAENLHRHLTMLGTGVRVADPSQTRHWEYFEISSYFATPSDPYYLILKWMYLQLKCV